MIDRNKIQQLVIQALQVINEEQETPFEIDENMKLIGSEGVLDSMDLVNLAAELEEKLSDNLDIDITIASEKAFSRKKSPFYNIESLTHFIVELAGEAK